MKWSNCVRGGAEMLLKVLFVAVFSLSMSRDEVLTCSACWRVYCYYYDYCSFFHVCHHSCKPINLKLAVGVSDWKQNICRVMKATDRCSLYGFSLPLSSLCVPTLSLSLYKLYFILHFMLCPPTGLPPPPAIARRGLKARGKHRLIIHITTFTNTTFNLVSTIIVVLSLATCCNQTEAYSTCMIYYSVPSAASHAPSHVCWVYKCSSKGKGSWYFVNPLFNCSSSCLVVKIAKYFIIFALFYIIVLCLYSM